MLLTQPVLRSDARARKYTKYNSLYSEASIHPLLQFENLSTSLWKASTSASHNITATR